VFQRVVDKIGAVDNAKIIATLHKGTWPTVEGNLRWNAIGEPTGNFLLVEWINGQLYPVLPKGVAVKSPVFPSYPWGK
jgi:branched-chain amino acid transport system substrate-binding protein